LFAFHHNSSFDGHKQPALKRLLQKAAHKRHLKD